MRPSETPRAEAAEANSFSNSIFCCHSTTAAAPTTTQHSRQIELNLMNQNCKVCGEVAAGYHFGAFTCEGCKSFFGRTYNNRSSIGECKNNDQCIINKKNRTSCKSCRLKKCFQVGMSKSGSRYGRRSNWFKIHCLLQDQQQQTNSEVQLGSSQSPPAPPPQLLQQLVGQQANPLHLGPQQHPLHLGPTQHQLHLRQQQQENTQSNLANPQQQASDAQSLAAHGHQLDQLLIHQQLPFLLAAAAASAAASQQQQHQHQQNQQQHQQQQQELNLSTSQHTQQQQQLQLQQLAQLLALINQIS